MVFSEMAIMKNNRAYYYVLSHGISRPASSQLGGAVGGGEAHFSKTERSGYPASSRELISAMQRYVRASSSRGAPLGFVLFHCLDCPLPPRQFCRPKGCRPHSKRNKGPLFGLVPRKLRARDLAIVCLL